VRRLDLALLLVADPGFIARGSWRLIIYFFLLFFLLFSFLYSSFLSLPAPFFLLFSPPPPPFSPFLVHDLQAQGAGAPHLPSDPPMSASLYKAYATIEYPQSLGSWSLPLSLLRRTSSSIRLPKASVTPSVVATDKIHLLLIRLLTKIFTSTRALVAHLVAATIKDVQIPRSPAPRTQVATKSSSLDRPSPWQRLVIFA
jgi:hypothetical protein